MAEFGARPEQRKGLFVLGSIAYSPTFQKFQNIGTVQRSKSLIYIDLDVLVNIYSHPGNLPFFFTKTSRVFSVYKLQDRNRTALIYFQKWELLTFVACNVMPWAVLKAFAVANVFYLCIDTSFESRLARGYGRTIYANKIHHCANLILIHNKPLALTGSYSFL